MNNLEQLLYLSTIIPRKDWEICRKMILRDITKIELIAKHYGFIRDREKNDRNQ